MKRIVLLLMSLLVLQGCREVVFKQHFDKQKWDEKEDWDYPVRNSMVDDLIKNHKIKGLKYKQLIALLNEPQGRGADSLSVYYQIVMDFGWDIDPVYTKNLEVSFNKDSVVNKITIKEWKKP
jgi:hypothetical protein